MSKFVTKGGRVQDAMRADTWNRFLRSADVSERTDAGHNDAIDGQLESPVLTALLSSPLASKARGDVVGITESKVDPSTDPRTFANRVVFEGTVLGFGSFGIVKRRIPEDASGELIVSGVTPTKLFVPTNGAWIDRADYDASDTSRLQAIPNGSAQILWKSSSSTNTEVDALVRLGNPTYVEYPGRADGQILHNNTGDVEIYDGSWTGYSVTAVKFDFIHETTPIADQDEVFVGYFPTEDRWRITKREPP